MRIDPYPNKEYENARYRECVYCGPLTERAELQFDSGSSEPSVGDVLVGATSTDYGTVVLVTLESGAWADGDAVGTIELSTLSGVDQDKLEVFEDNENINISGGTENVLTANGVGIIKRHGLLYPEQEMTKVDGRWFCNDHYQMRFPSKYSDEYRVEGSEEDLKDDD